MPTTRYSPDRAALRDRYAEIGHRGAARRRENLIGTRFDTLTWHDLTRAGLWRLPIATKDGGLGGDWWDFAAALEGLALGSDDIGYTLTVIAHAGILRILSEHGDASQKGRFLPALMSGAIASMALTEPSGGSDLPRLTTGSSRDGAGERLYGHKAHITNAPVADIILVAGRQAGRREKRDIGFFIVERGQAGLLFGPAETTLGHESSPTGEIVLEGVGINPVNRLEHEDGLSLIYDAVAFDRALYGLCAAATAEPWLARAFARTTDRRAFGVTLNEHQHVQQKLVEMKIAVETGRQSAYAALERFLDGDADARLYCAMAKLVATEGLWTASQNLMLLFGHQGYEQGEIARALCDAAGSRIAGGTSDIQKIAIFKGMERAYVRDAAAARSTRAASFKETPPCAEHRSCPTPSCVASGSTPCGRATSVIRSTPAPAGSRALSGTRSA